MDRSDFVDRLETEMRTELSRLGSSKSLYADTVGEMDPEPVLTAAADAASHAAETFEMWADETGHEVFANAASRERDHYEEILDELGEYEQGDPPAVATSLRDTERTPKRLGALVGWSLVMERKTTQTSGFFTGQAQPGTASTFRSFGDDYEVSREEALDTLETVSECDEDWDEALEAATCVIDAAYDEYFDTLEELGMNPKPVC